MTCALPALAFQGSTLILNRFWGFMCRFLTWVYCVMLRFGVQLISSPSLQQPGQEASPLSRGTSPGSQPTIQRNQPRKPAHYPEEPAQEASPLSRGTSPGSQPTIQRNQPRKPAHRPEEAAQEASPSSGGSSPGSQPIVRRKQPRKPVHYPEEPAQEASLLSRS
ncbi:synapsin-1-like isoform X3 [Macaca thibetana thibetana]|uniref:synapsin-1-like isoform X3 n=1 Tax=Macaca thibetana thibetana TaxID=257877 RepID=UPI0021BCC972|nr:synapsin-1-like isoform X3 [Macaca thibetana thibetana]